MDIYTQLINEVEQGIGFNIDLKTRTLRVGNKKLIDNGKYDGELGMTTKGCTPLNQLEFFYQNYKYSDPSKQSEKRRHIFYAIPSKEMTWEQMAVAEPREVARARLELFVLTMILEKFEWQEEMGSYFWKSPKDNDLILFREWFE